MHGHSACTQSKRGAPAKPHLHQRVEEAQPEQQPLELAAPRARAALEEGGVGERVARKGGQDVGPQALWGVVGHLHAGLQGAPTWGGGRGRPVF